MANRRQTYQRLTLATASVVVRRLVCLILVMALSACGSREQKPPASSAPPAKSAPGSGGAPPPPPEPAPTPPPPPPPAKKSKARPPSEGPPPATAVEAPAPGLPAFPWPPPRYSAFATIAREWVASGAHPTLASAAIRLEAAFDAAGYAERSYYWIPGGFALVSRIEQIRPDATPVEPPARWAAETARVREGFIEHIRALFNAPPGFYRVIVFAVTDTNFTASERPPTSSEARTWITSGTLRLPDSVGSQPYSDAHYTTALIYEFERAADQTEARVRVPSDSPGRVHLEKAGLWKALARP